ncbi:dephospho-CoA kinase [Blattabacterium cuenoti]|uniref:dephospho-CoA kinase n=1 Tax=Blattabacterium cuenoti TaxID=1653831 RepID=UPI00163B994C|nr:dephospho-CoA kinase [Blattabacterium cuenoti]
MKSLLIGITGEMGSGKSLLSSFFEKKGIPVYSSDKRSKFLMNQTKNIKENIIKFFGNKSYKNNKINKTFLSKKVFQDKDSHALKLLCTIVYPWILLDFKNWFFSQKTLFSIKESALLFESGSYKECDLIITINTPLKKRIERIIKRDKLSEKQIMNRIKIQIPDKEKEKHSDIIIKNDQNISFLQKEAETISNKIIQNIFKYGKRGQKN